MIGLKSNRSWSIIPIKERIKIVIHSCLIAAWILIKYGFAFVWRSENQKKNWTKPPVCLFDNAFGHHSYIIINGVKLHCVEVGNSNSPVAVLLHGFPDFWLGWRHQMKVLSNHFRVIAVDLKGFGDSDKPVWRRSYKLEVILKEIHELVNSIGCEYCTLIGHDLGAHIGWYFVTQYPYLVDKFVAISSPHPNLFWENIPSTSSFNLRWIHLCQIPLLPETEARKNSTSTINNLFRNLESDKKYKSAYKYAFSRFADWRGPINYYRNLPFYRIRENQRIRVPTMLILGNKDGSVSLESIVKSTEFVDTFALKIVENAGHSPHQEYPEIVNKFLLSFLTVPEPEEISKKSDNKKGLIENWYSSTMKYKNSLVDGVMKTTNDVVRLPSQLLYHSS